MTYTFLDPMRRDYRGRENEPGIDKAIVDGDLQDVDDCDILLANCPTPSHGTSMEIYHHASRGGYVITVCPNPRPSPWLTRWSRHVVPTIEDAIKLLPTVAAEWYSANTEVVIYLAGPINGCTDSQCRDWREAVKLALAAPPADRK